MFGSPLHLAPHAVANQESLSIAMAMLVHTKMEVPVSIPSSICVFCVFMLLHNPESGLTSFILRNAIFFCS